MLPETALRAFEPGCGNDLSRKDQGKTSEPRLDRAEPGGNSGPAEPQDEKSLEEGQRSTIMLRIDYRDRIEYSDEKAGKVALSETGHSRATLWCLAPGQRIAPHVHAGDHIWAVFEGSGSYLSEGGEPQSIGPGTVLVAPAGESHGVENTGSEGLVFLSVSAG